MPLDAATATTPKPTSRRDTSDKDSAYGSAHKPPGSTATPSVADHAELDILDSLGLADDTAPAVKLRHLLLDSGPDADESVSLLQGLINGRLEEGRGECLFEIGVEDNGDSMGFGRGEWDAALGRIKGVLEELGADGKTLITKGGVGGDVEVESGEEEGKRKAQKGLMGKMSIRRRPLSVDDVIETRIAVVGNVDAGKSTMLGVLVKGGLDDGRGKARVNLFRHKHEIESGRTSSVGMEIMGFDSRGEVVSSDVPGRKLSWEEIGNRSVSGRAVIMTQTVVDMIPRPRSSALRISLVTSDICGRPSLACSAASPTTAC